MLEALCSAAIFCMNIIIGISGFFAECIQSGNYIVLASGILLPAAIAYLIGGLLPKRKTSR